MHTNQDTTLRYSGYAIRLPYSKGILLYHLVFLGSPIFVRPIFIVFKKPECYMGFWGSETLNVGLGPSDNSKLGSLFGSPEDEAFDGASRADRGLKESGARLQIGVSDIRCTFLSSL